MYYEFFQQNKRQILTIGGAIIAIFILWTAITLIGRVGKTPLTIAAVPSDAKIIVEGHQLGNGTHWLVPGSYDLTVEKEGFEKQSQVVIVTPDKSNNVAALSLVPKSKEAKEWADKHAQEYQKNEAYGAIAARADGEYFTNTNPITKKLPFTDPYFSIAYIVNDDQSINITVSTPSPRYRFYAIEKIREWGFDPTDFKIVFKDFVNPLGVK